MIMSPIMLLFAGCTLGMMTMLTAPQSAHAATGVTPPGAKLDMFDYYIRDTASDEASTWNDADAMTLGINGNGTSVGHALKFQRDNPVDGGCVSASSPLGKYLCSPVNQYQSQYGGTLSGNGFPSFGYASHTTDSNGYPIVVDSAHAINESLSYLFDRSTQNGKITYANSSTNFFTKQSNGTYSFNCEQNEARFNTSTKSWELDSPRDGDLLFFPYNTRDEKLGNLNHYFGLKLTQRFYIPANKEDTNGNDFTFSSQGDDDTYVVIDGVVIAAMNQLLMTHGISINFTTGEVTTTPTDIALNTTIKKQFEAAGKTASSLFDGDTLRGDTYHTLSFFYLERGNWASNLKISYNIQSKPVTITYDKNSSAASGTTNATNGHDGDTFTIASNGYKNTGYTFVGWGETKTTSVGDLIQPGAKKAYTDNKTLYAQWRANGYMVVFDKNSSEASGSMSVMSMDYDTAKNLTANGFARPGYHFTNWNTKPDGTGTKYTDQQEVKNLTSTNGATITLYAQWEENDPITINYISRDSQHVSLTSSSDTVRPKTGNPSGSTAQPKTGYTFLEWDDENSNKLNTDKTFKPSRGADGLWHTATYYAVSRPNKYKVHYDKGATIANGTMPDQEMTYDIDTNLTKNAFTREGYHWAGWSKAFSTTKDYNDGETVKNLTDEDGATITLYARWETNNYIINYDKNATNATGTMDSQKMRYGVSGKLTSNKYTRSGYTFKNWNTNPDGTGTIYTNQQEVNNLVSANGGAITLYAQWTANDYTIKYNANDTSDNHATGTMNDQTINYDATTPLTKNTYARSGYTFKNWNTEANGAGKAYADMQEIRNLTDTNGGTATLYAQWSAGSYHVLYNDNDDDDPNRPAKGLMPDQEMRYDQSTALNANQYSREGYDFTGWNTNRDGSGTALIDKQEVKNLTTENNGYVTLYAQWRAKKYNVKFVIDGEVLNEQQIEWGAPATAPVPPSRDGFVFTGWDTAFDRVTGNLTVTARWEAVASDIAETSDQGITRVIIPTVLAVLLTSSIGATMITRRKQQKQK